MATLKVTPSNSRTLAVQQPQNKEVHGEQENRSAQQGRQRQMHVAVPLHSFGLNSQHPSGLPAQLLRSGRFALPTPKSSELRYQAVSTNSTDQVRNRYQTLGDVLGKVRNTAPGSTAPSVHQGRITKRSSAVKSMSLHHEVNALVAERDIGKGRKNRVSDAVRMIFDLSAMTERTRHMKRGDPEKSAEIDAFHKQWGDLIHAITYDRQYFAIPTPK